MGTPWKLQDAKNRFSEVVDRALTEGPQVVTRHGEKTVVILSFREYERMTRPKESLAEFLLHSPLAASDLEIERDRGLPRDVEVEP